MRGSAAAGGRTPAFALFRHQAFELAVYQREPGAYPFRIRAPDRILLYVVVGDVDLLAAELRYRRVRSALVAVPGTGHYCDVEDPDGHVLRFGTAAHPVLDALRAARPGDD